MANVFLGIDGIAQAAGAIMLVYGLTTPKVVLVRNDLAAAPKPTLTLTPMVGRGQTGMGLVGTF
jgi:hypothetical protein